MKRLQIVNELKGCRREARNDYGEALAHGAERYEVKSPHERERDTGSRWYRALHGFGEEFRCYFLCSGKPLMILKQENDMI